MQLLHIVYFGNPFYAQDEQNPRDTLYNNAIHQNTATWTRPEKWLQS